MGFFNFLVLIIFLLLTGCAVNPPEPQEPPISITLNGTSTEIQNFIEEKIRTRNNGVFRVENANDRVLTLKADCVRLQNQKPLQCGLIMMSIGNSKWDGPYLVLNFRTNQIRDKVNVFLQSEWCATNPFGKSTCSPIINNKESNEFLNYIQLSYEMEFRYLK